MNEFSAPRARRRHARQGHRSRSKKVPEQTLVSIAALEHGSTGRESSRHRPVRACINSVISRNKPYRPGHSSSPGSPRLGPNPAPQDDRRLHHQATRQGIVRRMRRHKGNEPAVYVRVGADVDRLPFEDMTLSEVMRAVF